MLTTCQHCGARDQVLGSVCTQCNTPIPNTVSVISYQVQSPNMMMVPVPPPPAPKKDRTGLWIALIALAALLMLCIAALAALSILANAGLFTVPTTVSSFVPPVAPIQPIQPVLPAPGSNTTFTSLNYDETNSDPLVTGQSKLVAEYLRIAAPISQGQLETAVSQIQQEAAASNATTYEGSTLKLDQHQAWVVWCSDATRVDPPADVSLVHEITLLAANTVGRVWIQNPFADGVPLRSDDTWTGCNGTFWAVAVH